MINIFGYILIIILFVLRQPTEKIAFIFFFLTVILYILGLEVDANHYMSVVYIFIVISVIKQLYIVVVKNK